MRERNGVRPLPKAFPQSNKGKRAQLLLVFSFLYIFQLSRPFPNFLPFLLAGFSPDQMYPEYSVDFFDGAHFVLKGSSPYTHPSARRASFRNWYQKQYPYVFAKFRVVKDVQ